MRIKDNLAMTHPDYSNEYYQASKKLLEEINNYRDFEILKDYFNRRDLFDIMISIGLKRYMEEFLQKFSKEYKIDRFFYFFSKKEMFNIIKSNIELEYNYKNILIVKIDSKNNRNMGEMINIELKKGEQNYLTSYVESRIKDKYIGYFLICMVYSLFETLPNMKIRGGFIRDMFNEKDNNDNIDIDIYINDYDLALMNQKLKFKNIKDYLEFKIDSIINSLANLIFDKSIDLEDLYKYKILTYKIKTLYCISLKYKINNTVISLDINYNGTYEFCRNIKSSEHNIDFEQNGLEFEYKESKLICKMYRKYENTTPYIKKELATKYNSIKIINKYITNDQLNNNTDIIRIIRDFIGVEYMYMLKIINTIINKEMYPTHNLCCNTMPRCIYDDKFKCKCSICHEIYKKIYNRYHKFSDKYKIHCVRCNKRLCIYDGILNNSLINSEEEDTN